MRAGDRAVLHSLLWSDPPEICYIVKIMEALSFDNRPAFNKPILVLSFAGWSDAGASATTAVRYLVDQLMAKKFATIDPGRVL